MRESQTSKEYFMEKTTNARKERTGIVASDCQDKTIVITVTRRVTHAQYKKIIKKSKRYTAHDEKNEAKVGDTVRIIETRPLSKNKCWRLAEIIERAVID